MAVRNGTPSSMPAGIPRSVMSPAGVRTTTAERLPTRARATGAIRRVCSGVSPNTVAIP
jgi:hypothetical protein